MRARFIALAAAIGLFMLAAPSRSYAGHHLWRLTHVFSNATGTVQYAQLFVTENGEAGVGPFTLTSSTGQTLRFGTNLSSSTTANTWILIGTPGFAALAGAPKPDYLIPAGFFATGGGTINYANVDIWNHGALPIDGVNALLRNGTPSVNAAINFVGQTATVTVPTAPSVPALSKPFIGVLLAGLLVAGSGLYRRRKAWTGRATA